MAAAVEKPLVPLQKRRDVMCVVRGEGDDCPYVAENFRVQSRQPSFVGISAVNPWPSDKAVLIIHRVQPLADQSFDLFFKGDAKHFTAGSPDACQ